MNIDEAVTRACDRIPGLVRGALVMLPDGFLFGATRGATFLDLEPLIRSAARCMALRDLPALGGRGPSVSVEHLFAIHEQLVVFEAGRRDPKLALLVVAEAGHNPAFVLGATRLALADLEVALDLEKWNL